MRPYPYILPLRTALHTVTRSGSNQPASRFLLSSAAMNSRITCIKYIKRKYFVAEWRLLHHDKVQANFVYNRRTLITLRSVFSSTAALILSTTSPDSFRPIPYVRVLRKRCPCCERKYSSKSDLIQCHQITMQLQTVP